MAHVREQIRKAVLSACTGLATTGTNVTTSLVYPYDEADLPALSILVARESEEEVESETMGQDGWRRLAVVIEAREAAAVSGLEDSLDDMCVEVEEAMTADTTLGGLAYDTQLISTSIELDASGEKPVGMARMTWAVLYRVANTAPTAPV